MLQFGETVVKKVTYSLSHPQSSAGNDHQRWKYAVIIRRGVKFCGGSILFDQSKVIIREDLVEDCQLRLLTIHATILGLVEATVAAGGSH